MSELSQLKVRRTTEILTPAQALFVDYVEDHMRPWPNRDNNYDRSYSIVSTPGLSLLHTATFGGRQNSGLRGERYVFLQSGISAGYVDGIEAPVSMVTCEYGADRIAQIGLYGSTPNVLLENATTEAREAFVAKLMHELVLVKVPELSLARSA